MGLALSSACGASGDADDGSSEQLLVQENAQMAPLYTNIGPKTSEKELFLGAVQE